MEIAHQHTPDQIACLLSCVFDAGYHSSYCSVDEIVMPDDPCWKGLEDWKTVWRVYSAPQMEGGSVDGFFLQESRSFKLNEKRSKNISESS